MELRLWYKTWVTKAFFAQVLNKVLIFYSSLASSRFSKEVHVVLNFKILFKKDENALFISLRRQQTYKVTVFILR